MALFFSAEAKEQPAMAAQAELEKVQKELARMKVRARYGSKLTDEEADVYIAEEADMVVRKAAAKESEEKIRQEEARIDKEIRNLAVELVHLGRMVIARDGSRVTVITPDLIITCPKCGKKLDGLSYAIYELAKIWYWHPDPEDRVNSFIVYNARNPLGSVIGMMAHDARVCPHCREHVGAFGQIVLV